MTLTLRHRGPDAGGVWVDAQVGVALGHRRLAIVELSERGAQPMQSVCGRYVITFNGEIYNHLALRGELEARGAVAWRGTSDTETLVECFAAWGVAETLKKSVGMFALGLWDRAERRLTLARDRFGEKPLFYGFVGQGASTAFVFGSELKALRAHPLFDNPIDRGAVALFLRFSYVPAPYSIFENTFKLEPGSILTLALDEIASRSPRIEPYWRYEEVALAGLANPVRDEREGLELLEQTLRQAVALQLVADVPVGAFLSGGVDSSTIVALMQAQSSRPVKTFTIGFDEAGFDEAPHAREVARHLATDHCEIRVTPRETQAVIPNLATMYDEPFGDSSQIPTSIVCAVARQAVTVALSGDAGDEMFGGYNRYMLGPKLSRRLEGVPQFMRPLLGAAARGLAEGAATWSGVPGWLGFAGELARFKDKLYKLDAVLHQLPDPDAMYKALVTEWTAEAVPVLSAPRLPTRLDEIRFAEEIKGPEQRMMLLDGVTYLPDDILAKVDRAAMAVSLETRVPMLDHRVAEAAWRLPLAMKIRNGCGKWALRQILYRHVPRELIERPKAGFAVPVGQWLRGPMRDWAESLLSEQRLQNEGYLKSGEVRQLWREHCSGAGGRTIRLWNILMLQAWLATQEEAPARGLTALHGSAVRNESLRRIQGAQA
jgi:asparagine synthase (glutamine-hydrolysing)